VLDRWRKACVDFEGFDEEEWGSESSLKWNLCLRRLRARSMGSALYRVSAPLTQIVAYLCLFRTRTLSWVYSLI